MKKLFKLMILAILIGILGGMGCGDSKEMTKAANVEGVNMKGVIAMPSWAKGNADEICKCKEEACISKVKAKYRDKKKAWKEATREQSEKFRISFEKKYAKEKTAAEEALKNGNPTKMKELWEKLYKGLFGSEGYKVISRLEKCKEAIRGNAK